MKKLLLLLLFVSFAAQGQINIERDSIGIPIHGGAKAESYYLNVHRNSYRIIDNFAVDYFYPQFGTISRRYSNGWEITFSPGGPIGDTRSWRQWFLDNRAHFEGFGIFADWGNEVKKVRVGDINLRMKILQFANNPQSAGANVIRVEFSGTRGSLPADVPIRIERFGTIPGLQFPCNCTPPNQ